MNNIILEIRQIIEKSKSNAVRSVNFERVLMYHSIGKKVFEEVQDGKKRAEYGKQLITRIAKELEPEFGSGFSARVIELSRQFYRLFPIANTLCSQLNWSQYRLLIRIVNEDKRKFYLSESVKNNWSKRQLERQINSGFFERLLLSNDKKSVLQVAKGQKTPSDPKEIIKDPMVLEFLGLKPKSTYYEKDLEVAIISHLQEFLLELGNGFSFVARQKRIHLDGDDFFIDLVFYNRLLQCFVLFEIKTHKLTHQDIGQLQMYVNYYDRVEKETRENSTIGILLCADKNNTMVNFALPENNKTIMASNYKLYLPSEKQLVKELKSEIKRINDIKIKNKD